MRSISLGPLELELDGRWALARRAFRLLANLPPPRIERMRFPSRGSSDYTPGLGVSIATGLPARAIDRPFINSWTRLRCAPPGPAPPPSVAICPSARHVRARPFRSVMPFQCRRSEGGIVAVRAALVLLLPARASTVCRVAIPAGGEKKGPISTAPRGGWSDLSGLESDASMDASPFFSASATTTEACVVAGSCARHKTTLGGCFVHKTNTEREHRSVSEFQSPQGDSC